MKKILLSGLLTMLWFIPVQSQNNSLDWVRSMGSVDFDYGEAIAIDPAGNVVVAGYFEQTVDFDPGPGILNITSFGDDDMFIMKLTPAGNLIWVKQFGGLDRDQLLAVAVDAAGNILATGHFQDVCDFDPGPGTANLGTSGGSSDTDAFILKLDGSGNYLWAHRFGNVDDDYGMYITTDDLGNIYTTGYFKLTVDFDPSPQTANLTVAGQYDVFILKLDSAGEYLWAGNIGGAFTEVSRSIFVDDDYNMYITGNFESVCDFNPGSGTNNLSSSGDYDGFVVKLDSAGEYRWARKGGSTNWDFFDTVISDNMGHIYLTGYYRGTMDLNPGAGSSPSTPVGDDDFFISKFDTAGIFVWGKSFGGLNNDRAFDLKLADNNTSVIATGRFAQDIDFDPGQGTSIFTSAGSDDIFILNLDTAGNLNWAKNFGGSGSEMGRAIVFDENSGRIYATGIFNGLCDFDPNAGVNEILTNGGTDIFVIKLGPSGVGIEENISNLKLNVYPNPIKNYFVAEWDQKTFPVIAVSVFDVTGRLLFEEQINNTSSITIETVALSQGVYFLEASTGSERSFVKLVKEN